MSMTAETRLDVLAVFSHPDDVELSVSGTLLKLKSLGYRTGACEVTRGEMGTRGTPEIRAQDHGNPLRVDVDPRRDSRLRRHRRAGSAEAVRRRQAVSSKQ